MTNAISSSANAPASAPARVAIIGGGSIGVRFAAAFLGAGSAVAIFEPSDARRAAIAAEVAGAIADIGDQTSAKADALRL